MKKYWALFLFTLTLGLGSGIWPLMANAASYTCPPQAEVGTGVFDGAILLPDNKTLWCLYKDNNNSILKKFEHTVTLGNSSWEILSKGGGFCMLGQDTPTRTIDCPINLSDAPSPKK